GIHVSAGNPHHDSLRALARLAGGADGHQCRAPGWFVRKFGNKNRAPDPRLARDCRGGVDAPAPERGGPRSEKLRENAIDAARLRSTGDAHGSNRTYAHKIYGVAADP